MKTLIAAVALGWSLNSMAAIDTYEFSGDEERARYRVLVEELRCPKCQNQNLADSNAPIAMDLRREIYRLLKEGQTDAQIVEYLVARYGDFVRYSPPLNANTLLLWLGPLGLLAGGAVLLRLIVRRKQRVLPDAQDQGLSDSERTRLASLLDHKTDD